MFSFDSTKQILTTRLEAIEEYFNADCMFYYGPIGEECVFHLLEIVTEIAQEKKNKELVVILTTGGGSIQCVERIVNILRYHYEKVTFIIPDYAYSAGTVLCMSGNEIYMNYYSVLGPIDPQTLTKNGDWVSAIGYLDKIDELLKKSRDGTLTTVEYAILKDFDLGTLKEYEQAKNLSIDLLVKYLIDYKFKDWNVRETTGRAVTKEYKKQRAEKIAKKLGSNEWYSHGRPINIQTLEELGLKINDYSENEPLSKLLFEYYCPMMEFINENKIYIHTRRTFYEKDY
ncbi:hypothetical protein MsAg5_10060 [Methanosarcinaceae archaeon Ag5]|uniref:Serine dehydrogenasease n=1 Tax=Methanolapillus africanus TaxID=3028297 RepID=A0AAE4MID9_9EURY|nr:hypothetical protein [Methanosarcinaceae archaeon Ag5]